MDHGAGDDVQRCEPARSASDIPAVPALSGRYLIGALLGRGGTAAVYRATHRSSGLQVAIKIFTPGRPGPGEPSGKHGEEAPGDLLHPGLVEIYEAGRDGGHPYLIMQLVDGESLCERIRRGPLPVGDVVTLGVSLSDALSHVHDRGIVHRDLKPANILLDEQERPFLTDFGVARMIDATRVTATGMAVGTPAFMAPEQVRGQTVGPAADIYSLGLVLLEALTGRREYPGSVVESAVARLHRNPVIPAGLPASLRGLLIAMTGAAPGSRPSAHAVGAQLTASTTASAQTTTQTMSSFGARPGRGRRRLRTVLLAAAAVVTALVTVGLGPPLIDPTAPHQATALEPATSGVDPAAAIPVTAFGQVATGVDPTPTPASSPPLPAATQMNAVAPVRASISEDHEPDRATARPDPEPPSRVTARSAAGPITSGDPRPVRRDGEGSNSNVKVKHNGKGGGNGGGNEDR